jgi:hypothetical protein
VSVSDAQKLKALEDENRRLKKLLVVSMLDVSAVAWSAAAGIRPFIHCTNSHWPWEQRLVTSFAAG